MNRPRTFLTAFALTGALALVAPLPASADISIRFSTGGGHGHQPKRHRGFPSRQPGHFQGHFPRQHLGSRHRDSRRHRPFSGRHQNHGYPRGGPRSGCHAITTRAHDAHGRVILLRETLCYDQFGRPYIPGIGRH